MSVSPSSIQGQCFSH